MDSRELVKRTLEFKNSTGLVPRHKWILKWAELEYPDEVRRMHQEYPDDIVGAPAVYLVEPVTSGDPFARGQYQDAWGCTFTNVHPGIIGEVKEALIQDEDWEDAEKIRFPKELLTVDQKAVNTFCSQTDKFVLSALSPRPFERLQFLRGTEDFLADLVYKPAKMVKFMHKMHDFYCEMLEQWAKTDVDAVKFMDDWGAQNSMLISKTTWDAYFKPMYKDYIAIGKKYGKKVFMHSDGNILPILPDLIEMGLDAINCQVFCMGVDNLSQFAGNITFWGEIDRQHILPEASVAEVHEAVAMLKNNFWKEGGAIAQCEFGPGANPQNIDAVFAAWNKK